MQKTFNKLNELIRIKPLNNKKRLTEGPGCPGAPIIPNSPASPCAVKKPAINSFFQQPDQNGDFFFLGNCTTGN